MLTLAELRLKSALYGRRIKLANSKTGRVYLIDDYGLISTKLITNVGVNALVDAFQGLFAIGNFKWHISGTDTDAESVNDTEATITGSTPAPVEGTQEEGASSNIYKTIGVVTYSSSLAITSHGLINSNTKAGSVLWDRSVFSPRNVDADESIEFTYELTCISGG